MSTDAPDALDQAIKATEPAPQAAQITLNVGSSGRQIGLLVAKDLTDAEIMEIAAWILSPESGLRSMLRPPSPIAIARVMPTKPS